MIKLIIFDFDDTIVNNTQLDYQSFKNISLKFNAYIPKKKELLEMRIKNYDSKKIIKYILKKSNNKFNTSLFFKKRNDFLLTNNSEKYLILKPHSKKIIKKLFSQHYILLILSLRKKKSTIQKFLEKNNLLFCFKTILNPEDSKLEMRNTSNAIKTKNFFLKKIPSIYDINNHEILFIGDSEADFQSAKQNHVNFVLFENRFIKYTQNSNHKIDSLRCLEFILKQFD